MGFHLLFLSNVKVSFLPVGHTLPKTTTIQKERKTTKVNLIQQNNLIERLSNLTIFSKQFIRIDKNNLVPKTGENNGQLRLRPPPQVAHTSRLDQLFWHF